MIPTTTPPAEEASSRRPERCRKFRTARPPLPRGRRRSTPIAWRCSPSSGAGSCLSIPWGHGGRPNTGSRCSRQQAGPPLAGSSGARSEYPHYLTPEEEEIKAKAEAAEAAKQKAIADAKEAEAAAALREAAGSADPAIEAGEGGNGLLDGASEGAEEDDSGSDEDPEGEEDVILVRHHRYGADRVAQAEQDAIKLQAHSEAVQKEREAGAKQADIDAKKARLAVEKAGVDARREGEAAERGRVKEEKRAKKVAPLDDGGSGDDGAGDGDGDGDAEDFGAGSDREEILEDDKVLEYRSALPPVRDKAKHAESVGEFSAEHVDRTLFWAVYRQDNVKTIKALRHGGDPGYTDKGDPHHFSSMHWAVKLGQMGMLRSLLEPRGDPNQPDKELSTPLHLAAGKGSKPTIQLLLQAGADMTRRNNRGHTVVQRAEICGFTLLAKWIQKQ